MAAKRIENSKERLLEKMNEGKKYLEKESHDKNELTRLKNHLEKKKLQLESDLKNFETSEEKDEEKNYEYECFIMDAGDTLDDLEHHLNVILEQQQKQRVEREAEEKRLEREAEKKRLEREREEKRLEREAEEKRLEREAEEKRLEREREAEEKRLEREAEEKVRETEEKRREQAFEVEKMKLENTQLVEMERLKLEQLKIDNEMKQKDMELENAVKLAELNQDSKAKHDTKKYQRANLRLPKLELIKFDGNIFKWQEFWDAFNTSINMNDELSGVEKFNYLRTQVQNEAKEAISGLETTEANYNIAVDILQDRYGKKQLIINAHYTKLKEMPVSTNHYERLQATYDSILKHLRSLGALGENIESNLMMSLIQSKLPRHVLARLEEYKNNNNPWTVEELQAQLKRYIAAQEIGNRLTAPQYETSKKEENRDRHHHRPSHQRQITTSFHAGEREKRCIYCSKGHWSDECKEFSGIESRKKQIHGRCFICLKKGHLLKNCSSKKVCVYCNKEGNHHRSLCPTQFQQHYGMTNSVQSSMVAIGEQVMMQTATVELTNPSSDITAKTRLLLDCGSQRTYITEDLASKLKLKSVGKSHLTVYTFGTSKPKDLETRIVNLTIQLKSGFPMNIKANVVPEVTGEIERIPIKSQEIRSKLQTFQLADDLPTSLETTKIQLLIGNDYYTDIVSMKRIEITKSLHLLSSKIGWILTGRTQSSDTIHNDMVMLTSTRSRSTHDAVVWQEDDPITKQLDPDLEKLWKLETIGIKDTINETTDDKVLEEFNENVEMKDGRYHVTWPWKTEDPELPDNYQLAYGRLKSTVKRMKENDDLIKAYDNIIKDQLDKGIIEKIDLSQRQNLVHYIPHHAVVTPGKTTTKVRIVYDASAKSKSGNQSLNECMHRGPVILEDLCTLLLRFRTNKIAVVADIEKAFLQIALQESERDVTRFLWIKDMTKPVTDNNIEAYRFARVPFGIISSPFLLSGSIQHHLKATDTTTASKISKELYVDNLVTGEATTDQAIQLYNESKQIFKDMSMNLREWASNSSEVMQRIPEDDRAKGEAMKVLGMEWKQQDDTINIGYKNKAEAIPTKRQILKETAEVFDPLGLFTPVTLQSKILLQELWKEGKEWDDPINHNQKKMWETIRQDLNELHTMKLPRYVGGQDCTLLCFSDASGHAYATTVYLLTEENGKTRINLVFSKSRIAPAKTGSIPRLELLGVLIGVRSLNFVQESLKIPIKKKILWTDSQCVLSWIKSTKPLPCFVENRLKEIKNSDVEFRYINTKENPADLASRGKTLYELRNNNLWWHGPSWLNQPEDSWPNWKVEVIDHKMLLELAKKKDEPSILYEVSTVAGDGPAEAKNKTDDETNPPYEIDVKKHSSFNKLIRITAWMNRFIYNIRGNQKKQGNLSCEETQEAKMMWIKHVQKEATKEISKKKTAHKEINKLNLKIDEEGIIRCYGRLAANGIDENILHPIYLPKKNYFTRLVIKDYHEKLFHAGTSHTLSYIRRIYWIPHGRTEVRSTIFRCGTCKKYQGGPFKMPNMSPWPNSKVTRSAPFTHTGLDYLGPMYIKEGTIKKKVWICLFTCVTVRAIHLEVIDDMSADQFLMALRRFIARRGTPKEIICDNASQFKAAKTATDKTWNDVIKDNSVFNYTSTESIKWKFIVEFSPWSGGFYERLVGMVKSSLRKSIGTLYLTKTQLTTFATEAEGILNSRPIVYVDEDIESSNTITPSHFLSPNPTPGIPATYNDEDSTKEIDDEYIGRRETSADQLIKLWKKGQAHLNRLWKVWYNQYVLSLRERYQIHIKEPRTQSCRTPKIGEIVHVKENTPRGMWKMGKIDQLIQSNDGKIRAAKVKMSNGHKLNRPLNLLFPMELAGTTEDRVENVDIKTDRVVRESKRTAAKNAKLKIRLQMNNEKIIEE